MSEAGQYHVFLSHNSADKPAMEALACRLAKAAEHNTILDVWHLAPSLGVWNG